MTVTDAHDLDQTQDDLPTLSRVEYEQTLQQLSQASVDRHFNAFIDEFSPSFLFQEETVWSDTHLYAGSFDALAEIEGQRVWIDWKTTRSGVHEEVLNDRAER